MEERRDFRAGSSGRLVARGANVEVWVTSKPEVVVLGTPLDHEDLDVLGEGEEFRHDCDLMGCGSCHVIWRSEAPKRVAETAVEIARLKGQIEEMRLDLAEARAREQTWKEALEITLSWLRPGAPPVRVP